MSDNTSDHSSRKRLRKANERLKVYQEQYLLTNKWKGLMDAKLNNASPYYFFLTRIEESVKTHDEDLTISFPDLLDQSLGILVDSLHINFMVELPWLLAQYAVNDLINPHMTILYDCEDDDLRKIPPHLKLTAVKIKNLAAFGHHHTKMSIFYYKDKSLRFSVYTANLIESDWENRTQGVWISPKCPFMGDDVPVNYGESESLFKIDVLQYLNSYHLPQLRDWLHRIKRVDCSSIKVCFVASVPGDHTNSSFGLNKISKIIKEHCKNSDVSSWELVAQCSSIGSLGPEPTSWLYGQFAESFRENFATKNCSVSVIYPSVENVRQSHDGMLGGACLPYSSTTHQKQFWLSKHLKQWKSNHRHRSKAVPHIKSYTKLSPNGDEIAWFLLTSANLSKAAWGRYVKDRTLKILSYEAGVLFLPQFFVNKNCFTVKKRGDSNANDESFPLPYDTPLTSYLPTDRIFLYDKFFPHKGCCLNLTVHNCYKYIIYKIQNSENFNQRKPQVYHSGLVNPLRLKVVMSIWILLFISTSLMLETLQQKTETVELEATESPYNIVNNDTECFNVKAEACGLLEEKDPCLCKVLDSETVYCCHITNPYQLNNNLRCAGVQPSGLKYMHIRNATLQELTYFTFEAWPRLESFSITEGKIEQISSYINSNLICFNVSTNSIFDIEIDVFLKLPNLDILDLSKNNLTKLPSLKNKNISLDISDNGGVECQTLMQFLTENPNTNFVNVDSTYCFSSKNFHWFNSIAQVPLSQVLILRNIEQNCTKGCSCRSHRLDMVSGKHPTISVLVDCSSLGLKKLPEYLPTNTISLNVSYNNITSLDPLTFDESYKDIREFYADYNQISSILALEGSKFIDNFLVLSLRENNIKSLPTYILSNTFDRNYHIRRVNLGGNRLVCNCSVAQVVKVWLLSNKKHIPDYDQVLCDNTGEKVMALDQNKVCVYQRDWTDYIYYIIAGEVCLLLILLGKVSYDYWVFKSTGYLPWPASKMPKLPCDWVLE